jgi:hypothetical protein
VVDVQLGDLFAFSVNIPGQQPLIMCTSNEKERLQWRLAFTYSIHSLYLAGSVKNQLQYFSLAQGRLADMRRIALLISQCKNRLLILPPSFRRADKSVTEAQAVALSAAGSSAPNFSSTASVSKLRSSSAYATATKSPPSVVYELAGREVSDCGIQADGPRQRASAAATPIANLLQSMKPQSARTVDMVSAPHAAAVAVESAQPKQQMDLKPHKVPCCCRLAWLRPSYRRRPSCCQRAPT